MSDRHCEPAGGRSEDASRLWLAMTEQAAHVAALERQLVAIRSSRSWRITAPLRALFKWLEGAANRSPSVASLRAADAAGRRARREGRPPAWVAALLPGDADARPRWLIDVTELALEDLGAGVQRVTRRLLAELLLAPPDGYRIEPVRLTPQASYCHARAFLTSFLGLPVGALGGDEPVTLRPGDRFVGLDFCRDRAPQLERALHRLQAAGVTTSLMVHDVLPLTNPEWFPPHVSVNFEAWLKVLSERCDQAICNSHDTAAELERALIARGLTSPRGGLAVIPLGGDLLPAPETARVMLPDRTERTRRVLSVGTIEPRKGLSEVLDAFELLWAAGASVEWVIAGRVGWHVDDLVTRLRHHPEAGSRLHWLDGPDDVALRSLFRECDVLLASSHAEGFGLPIAEAGTLGMPLLLRDIPVFREVAGAAADYATWDSAAELAEVIGRWQAAEPRNCSDAKDWATWAQSAGALIGCIGKFQGLAPDAGSTDTRIR